MKTTLQVVTYSVLLFFLSHGYAGAQTGKKLPDYKPGSAGWKALIREKMKGAAQQQKAGGRIAPAVNRQSASLATPACFVPVDGTFTALPRNNDGSSSPIILPFSFDLYGTPYRQVYINTNGVLSFVAPEVDNFSFPLPYYLPVIAPFWADIDTRSPESGQIYYKVTPTHLIVTWDRVGYADEMADKVNTFQVIIGLPGDELLGPNANVKMNYGDMQWATAYEFGDFPSLVGISGDYYQNYQQIGWFDKLDDSYDGPGGQKDGIGYLANKCFSYDVRTLTNIPPQLVYDNLTRLIELNVGDTVEIEPYFTSPEPGQTVTTLAELQGGEVCKLNYSVTNGATSKIKIRIIGDLCNVGVHILWLTAVDDGNPQQSTTIPLLFWVKNENVPVITFPAPEDEDGDGRYPLKATASNGQGIYYEVMSGPGYIKDDTLVATGVGAILVRALTEDDGTTPVVFQDALVCVSAKNPGPIAGDSKACLYFKSTYEVPAVDGAIYTWTVDGGTIEFDDNKATVTWKTLGTHQLSVSYTTSCGPAAPPSTLTVQVTTSQLPGAITKMLPSDGNVNVSFPLTFSWFPVEKATSYDIYVWPESGTQPEEPMINNITNINYTLYSSDKLEYGKSYKWRVLARGDCSRLESPVQTFKLRFLPDLVPYDIQIPANAFSGQEITVSWKVRNQGPGSTLDRQWIDKIFLSLDELLDDNDIQGTARNTPGALNSGGSYANSATFTLPNGISNRYYIFVLTNEYNQLIEKDESNNLGISATKVNIQLTPPPDLQVTTVTPPNNAFSGQPIEVIYTVQNAGTGKTGGIGWNDVIFLSKEEVLKPDSAIRLRVFFHAGELSAGGSYTQRITAALPDTISGNYYVHVAADWTDMIYEHATENNNTGSSGVVNIILAPPVDLVVTNITIPATAPASGRLSMSWHVENAGGAATSRNYWRDDVYLSPTPVWNKATAIPLATISRTAGLNAGEGYTAEWSFNLPRKIAGNYYVIVKADAVNDVYEYQAEGNNESHSLQPLLITAPDLIVSNITVPATGISGQAVNIEWTVKNDGGGVLENTKVTDRILLSKSATFDEANSQVVKVLAYQTRRIPAGDDTLQKSTIVLPEGISGNYYVYVQTDYTDTVFESNSNNNIRRSAAPVTVTLGPWADLQVSTVQAPATAAAAEAASISYTVFNRGNRATNDSSWTDKVFVSLKPVWDPASAVLVSEIAQKANIGKDSSYTITTSLVIPGNIGGADYYVYVLTNAGKRVYEHSDTANNTGRSNKLFIKKYPPVDLVVTSVVAPATGKSGTPVTVKWAVKNTGEAITLPNQWNDGIYLSADTVWDSNDQLVKSFAHRGQLPVAAAYTNEQEITIPNGVSGKYYLLLATDKENLNYDADTTSNVGLVRPAGGGSNDPVPIGIELTPPANLVVAKFTVPDEGFAGQPIKVKWTVKNDGSGITNKSSWTERVYLSKDINWDKQDRTLGTFIRSSALSAGAQYEDSLEVFLPENDLGNHVLIFRSDINDNVYEHGAEENIATALITIVKDNLSDLVVTDVQIPASGIAGSEVIVRWKLKNVGANPARGFLQQNVYLSADTTKDVSDILVARAPIRINLAPNAVIDQAQPMSLKGVALRDYYALVHTDVLNNIAESNDENNLTPSAQPLGVTVEELEFDNEKQGTLRPEGTLYYRLEVADSLAGESLLITLQGDTAVGDNAIFVRANAVPDMAVHDFAGEVPYQANQEIIIPALKPGTYYLMINGRMRTGTTQPVKVKASVLHFEIRSVEAAEGGNTGVATVLIKGSKMNGVTAVRLRNATGTITAESVQIIDPVSLYARFDLNGAAAGTYDVVAVHENGDSTALEQGFTIVAGAATQLTTNVISPPNTRPSNVLSIQVEFANTGNTDIINPVVRLTSLGGAPIALKPADLVNAGKELTLTLQEPGGPAGRLRPGAKGTVIVYAKATTVLGFMLMDNEE
ncbi:MAG: hypothetical protein J7621_25170 [Niastella sp.]|nr:hypothetical protein [Niastella sp.]